MLTLLDLARDHNCQGFARREFLKIGALGLGSGLTLPALMQAKAAAATAGSHLQDRSIVFLFLQGGPSHIELFDPKMTAPIEFRSVTGEVHTKTPGITFGGTFPQLAAMSDRLTIVRNYASNNADHTYLKVASGDNSLKATVGAMYSRIVGMNNPQTGMPTNILVLPEAVQDGLKLGSNFETGALPTLTAPGDLGPSYAAFNPSGGGQLKQDMDLKITPDRLEDRRGLLSQLDRMRRQAESVGLIEGMNKYEQQAFDVITRGVAEAFDVTKEDASTLAAYDTSHVFNNAEVQKWGDMRRSTNLLGKQLLLARRLCEAGCGFVTVSDCGWDMHSNGNSPKNLGGMKWLGSQVDHAVAAFIRDVEQRGLSDKILLVVTGEMGRTPRINRDGGRDHYGNLTPLLVYGGGLKMGQTIGASDSNATRAIGEPWTPKNLVATMLHTLFDLSQLRLVRSVPREILKIAEDAGPIAPLI